MSDKPLKNEDMINELTAGLSEFMIARENSENSNVDTEKAADPTDSSPFEQKSSDARETSSAAPSKEYQKDFDEDHAEKSDEDDIDEVALKDAELDLTEDQKEERRIIAEALKKAGNDAYQRGNYELSAEKYTQGLMQCPFSCKRERAILYCNRSAAKMKLEKYDKAIADCTKSIELDEKYTKAYVRRAQSYESKDKLDEALADYKKILELEPGHSAAKTAATRLPPLIEERNEKLKVEMMGKLKDLGNIILKPFGLSTENFQVNQDPESKGYSINFKK